MSLLEAATAALEVKAWLRQHRLGAARLWHSERTSQRKAVQRLRRISIICGGNRSGKSEAGAQYAVACALGRNDPEVEMWAKANGIPIRLLPPQAGVVWAVALDSGDSREYVRPKVAAYLPHGCKWRNRDGFGPAEVVLPSGGRIVFKSADQGRDGFQGSAVDLVWFDEEPRDKGVVDEALMRLVDRRGRMLFTMTPLLGLTWLYDRWVAQPSQGVRVSWLHGPDNPHLPPGALDELLRQYGPHERAARERGEWVAMEGRVYTDFSRAFHVVPAHTVPDDWPRYGAIDFGTRNPFAYLHCALDPADDTLHVLAVHYKREWTLGQHAGAIRKLWTRYGAPELVVADPEDRGSRLSLAREHGISTARARKEVRAGINAVSERLALDVEGRPHLLVHDCCAPLVREFEGYVWDTMKRQGDLADKPRKANDHALDALRYLCLSLQRTMFAVA